MGNELSYLSWEELGSQDDGIQQWLEAHGDKLGDVTVGDVLELLSYNSNASPASQLAGRLRRLTSLSIFAADDLLNLLVTFVQSVASTAHKIVQPAVYDMDVSHKLD